MHKNIIQRPKVADATVGNQFPSDRRVNYKLKCKPYVDLTSCCRLNHKLNGFQLTSILNHRPKNAHYSLEHNYVTNLVHTKQAERLKSRERRAKVNRLNG